MDYLFQIGDKIVYPMQGAGIIKGIEEKEISGTKQTYYLIHILSNKMQVMIPSEKILNTGIRLVVDSPTLEDVLLNFQGKELYTNESLTHKERYQINMDKIRTGRLKEGFEVVHDLLLLNSKKPLNTSEKQMLSTARKILVGEMALIKGITENQADDLLNDSLN
ncbi:CarD family transcriptional regulator [Clostridium polyendosporum]|uniref:CarD family transcriptional regulator n=1 Tax=Clostridium polyendosporum TaxID=69208 RepID=UPI001FE91E2F